MHLLRYRGDICGVALFFPPLLVLLGLLGSWMGKGAGSVPYTHLCPRVWVAGGVLSPGAW